MKRILALFGCRIARQPSFYIGALLLVFAASRVEAAVDHSLDSFTESNYTGYVIASDASNANVLYDRDAIAVAIDMEYTRSGATNHHYEYRFNFQLLDENDQVQTIKIGGGTGNVLSVTEDVNMGGGPATINRITTARLRPHTQLNAGNEYRVSVSVERRSLAPPGVYSSTGIAAETNPNTYKHFPSLVSGDAALNVISEVQTVSWNRRYRVQTDAANDFYRVDSVLFFERYDAFGGAAPESDVVNVRVTATLRDDLGNLIPLEENTFDVAVGIDTFDEGNGFTPRSPASRVRELAFDLRPIDQLPSHARNYKVTLGVSHFDQPGVNFPIPGTPAETASVKLLDFNGTLAFAGTSASFTSIAYPPPQVGNPLGIDFIDTSLRINNLSGSFQGLTFGNGTELPVRLRDDGVATLTSGTLTFNGTGFPDSMGNLFYELSGVTANADGINGDLRLELPSGLGIADDADTRIHEPELWFNDIALTPQLSPTVPTLTSTGTRWATEESKPILFESSAIHWDVLDDRIRFTPTGNATWVRAIETNTLENDVTINGDERIKPSNDGYYRNLNGVISAEVIVEPDPSQGSAQMTGDFSIGDVFFFGHFPLNSIVSAQSGSIRIEGDRVATDYGGLIGNGAGINARVDYRRDCPDGNCGDTAGTANINLRPDDSTFHFTRDGGLRASGFLPQPHDLSWGWIPAEATFAHTVQTFTAGAFHMPGTHLIGSDQAGLNAAILPARILLSGVNNDLPTGLERPGSATYKAGVGDYAGLNFRVVNWGDQDGVIVLAGDTSDPFPLTNRAKYYVRMGGITGIHEAINGQFNPTAVIYGMDFEFTTLGWAFLDSVDVVSRTAGNLQVPYPSDFGLDFEELRITCLGALETATMSDADVNSLKKLAYWNADFRPITLAFEGPDAAACDPGNRRLVLGIEAYAGGITTPLTGRIGFQTNGNLVTLASGDLDAPFDSRFRLPNNFELKGPAGETYQATPVGEAYLNDWSAAQDADFGWMNLAAMLDVPFFSDMEVHLHTSAVKDDPDALYYVMGGWPDQGFDVNGKHFFNEVIFDTGNRGFPAGATLTEYRSGFDAPNESYRPRVFKRWLGVVDLEYPLSWRSASRSFASFTETSNDFFVLSAEHRVDYLSAKSVEVSFGADASLIPKINIANFVADKATDVTSVLSNYLASNVVDEGIQGLNEFLDVKQRDFFAQSLDPMLDEVLDEVIATLNSNWSGATKTWGNPNLEAVLENALFDNSEGVFAKVNAGLAAARDLQGVLQEVDMRLEKADLALDTIEGFIEEKNGQTLGDLQSTVLDLAALVSAALDKPEFTEKIDALMTRAEPRIIEIRKLIGEVRSFIGEVRTALDENGQFANQVITIVDENATEIQDTVETIRSDIVAILAEVKEGVDSVPDMEAQLRQRIKDRLQDRILGLRVIADLNRLLKQQLYDASARMTEAIDEVFDQINVTLRDVIREVAGGLDERFEEALGDVAGTMATANVNGYAKVRNDSLTELRLDLKAKLAVPDDMKAHVFLLIRELSSENFPAECLSLPAEDNKATEVTIGAKDVSAEWIFPDTTLDAHGKFVMDGSQENFPLRGMGGGFMLKGEISFGESIIIHELGASVMFSLEEAWLSAAAQLEVQGFAGGGGIFLGRACSLDPFFWDPTVESILGEAPFTGVYGYGEFWIPVPTLIGIPSTCLFNLSAGVGAGAGIFAEGPTVFGKMFLGVSGDVLCIVNITGEISLAGLARPTGLALAGEGRFAAEVGPCPLCLEFDKSIRLTREGGNWSHSIE